MGRHYIGVALDRSSCTIDAAAPKFCFSPCNTGLGNLTPCHLLLEHDSTLLRACTVVFNVEALKLFKGCICKKI
jgi:hypothetical protein